MENQLNINSTELDAGLIGDEWKILIVDDEEQVHRITTLVLDELRYENRPVLFLSAFSAGEAYAILEKHPDIALILLDVVMETDNAGLELVKTIREELGNTRTRIILRTGQPGQAPEQKVILEYDINDYKEKTELTAAKLYTSVIASLRAYRDICAIEIQKQEIEQKSRLNKFILDAMPCETLLIKSDGTIVLCSHNSDTKEKNDSWVCSINEGRCSEKCSWMQMKLPLHSKHFKRNEISVGNIPYEVCFFPVEEDLNLAYAFDISDRKKYEEEKQFFEQQLTHTQKMEAIGLLASGVAHDFNNHLTGVMAFAALLEKRFANGTKEQDYAQKIVKGTTNASNLVKKLLDFSREKESIFKSVDIHTLLDDVHELLRAKSKNVKITMHKNAPISSVVGDADQLLNAFINLGINAIHAMPQRGNLIFETSMYKNETSAETFYLTISVSDTGCGIPDDVKKRIFEPFFTTKEVGKGTGLGLAGVYGCVKRHHGIISVDSTVNEGTTFTIMLPLLEDDAAATNGLPSTVPGKTKYCTILIGDDDPITRSLTFHFLSDIGHTVRSFENGPQLIDYIKPNDTSPADLCILNLDQSEMKNFDTFIELNKINPDIPILLITDDANVREQYTKDGRCITCILSKPFTRESFYNAVAHALSKKVT